MYEELIKKKYKEERFTVIPAPLILEPLKLLRDSLDNGRWPRDDDELVSMITRNTAEKSIDINSNTTPESFFASFTGENLRWEFVGTIFTLAGLADIEPPSHHIYRVFGELVSHMHALGIHRRQSCTLNIPFFLSEARKRVFIACFRTDKNLATFLGRPPRLPGLYCDTDLPLDIEDNSLMLDEAPLQQLLSKLSPDGWNESAASSDGRIRPATAIRVRFMIGTVREQVLALSIGKKTKTFHADLQTVYQECKELWDKIPRQFHYHETGWEQIDSSTSIVSLAAYLEYLQTISQLERIRCRENPDAMLDLLDVSMRIVSTVIDFTKVHDHIRDIRRKYAWTCLLYALPAAGVLATELHRCTVRGTPLPCSVPRSTIIRNLSLLVSWFDDANGNISVTHRDCARVSEIITRLLDETLNHQPNAGYTVLDGQRDALQNGAIARTNVPMVEGPDTLGSQIEHYQLPGENGPNVNAFGTSVEFLDWWDDFWVDTSIPEALL
ncbi:hypothetical protein EYZ11_011544 [Aspergillus tanneri]|uniref:Xylanolytic transcriptional activator regulatory domain-containing protein n=1 Tax=Aspergillus tanneri TaxID=1220188 RepID=A0A4S3J2I2_9EURO|nr:hypothetical protein EYZ11_011544 [Aspergillus tanneri]